MFLVKDETSETQHVPVFLSLVLGSFTDHDSQKLDKMQEKIVTVLIILNRVVIFIHNTECLAVIKL